MTVVLALEDRPLEDLLPPLSLRDAEFVEDDVGEGVLVLEEKDVTREPPSVFTIVTTLTEGDAVGDGAGVVLPSLVGVLELDFVEDVEVGVEEELPVEDGVVETVELEESDGDELGVVVLGVVVVELT